MRIIPNTLSIIGFSFLSTLIGFYFGYIFLYDHETSHNQSLDDIIVDDDNTWIKDTLKNIDSGSPKYLYNHHYGQYFKINNYCNLIKDKTKPTFDKLVFIVIDALRIDFVPSIEKGNLKHTRMNYIENILANNGIGLISLATIPTVTLPRVKALLSGTLPSFMDYILNLSSNTFQSDNFVKQLALLGKRIVFYGDDTWSRLFSSSKKTFVRSNYTSSLFATDYTFVDLNVTWNVKNELDDLNSWDVMLLHYLGVDHIGHLKGYHSPLFKDKLQEMDQVFQNIYQTVHNKASNVSYLFVITGDHGMTNSGNHGGDTRDETHTAALFISSESQFFSHNKRNSSQNSHISKTVMQIDLAPTISALFNSPFPTRCQGRVISSVLERFKHNENTHLCNLFKNSFLLEHLIDKSSYDDRSIFDLKNNFLGALNAHDKFIFSDNETDEKKFLFIEARDFYQAFLGNIQKHFVKISNGNISNFRLSILVVISFILIFVQLYNEYRSESLSILFCHRLFNQSPLKSLEEMMLSFHFGISQSTAGVFIGFVAAIGPIFCMGSVRFMELEYIYWQSASMFLIIFLMIISLKFLYCNNSSHISTFKHYQTIFFASLFGLLLLQLSNMWRRPIYTEEYLNIWDVFTWLNKPESKSILGVFFTFSLVSIVLMTPLPSNIAFPRTFFISSFIFIYLFRTQTGSIRLIRFPIIMNTVLPKSNFLVELVWWHCGAILALTLYNRYKQHIFFLFSLHRKMENIFKNFIVIFEAKSKETESKKFSSFFYTFILLLIISSCLLIEPAQLPVFALNMALEQLINIIFSNDKSSMSYQDRTCFHKQTFFKLVIYHVMAFNSFYQMGNSNGLSTVNVNACFVGLDSYQLLPCTIFMIISMFGTYIYWILAFYIRQQQNFNAKFNIYNEHNKNDDDMTTTIKSGMSSQSMNVTCPERLYRKTVIENYCTFYSTINCNLILRISTMTTNLIVTLILRDHLFIWSVICPKLLYELIITIITVLLHFFISLMFTHDNCFNLKKT